MQNNIRVLTAQLYKAQLNAAIYTSRSSGSVASAAFKEDVSMKFLSFPKWKLSVQLKFAAFCA